MKRPRVRTRSEDLLDSIDGELRRIHEHTVCIERRTVHNLQRIAHAAFTARHILKIYREEIAE